MKGANVYELVDHKFSEKTIIGVAVGYNKSNISADTAYQNRIGIDSYQIALYNSNSAKIIWVSITITSLI